MFRTARPFPRWPTGLHLCSSCQATRHLDMFEEGVLPGELVVIVAATECAAVTCAEKRQRVWRCLVAFEDTVPASAWSSRNSWNALNCDLGDVCHGVVGYANATASSLNLKHQTKSTGVFRLLVEGELWCETSCEHVTFITVSVLMLGNNQGIQFQLRPPGRPVFRHRSKIQYATHGWFSSDILQAGASEHGLAICQLAWVQ